jgi:hypothetical protein
LKTRTYRVSLWFWFTRRCCSRKNSRGPLSYGPALGKQEAGVWEGLPALPRGASQPPPPACSLSTTSQPQKGACQLTSPAPVGPCFLAPPGGWPHPHQMDLKKEEGFWFTRRMLFAIQTQLQEAGVWGGLACMASGRLSPPPPPPRACSLSAWSYLFGALPPLVHSGPPWVGW